LDPKKQKEKTSQASTEEFDEQEQLDLLSKVIKVSNVEEFRFEYKDNAGGKTRTKELKDLQAILINPKWADHGFTPSESQTSTDNIVRKGKRLKQLEQRRAAFAGTQIEDFKKLIIPDKVMKDGILFVWAEKELISEIVLHFEEQGFQYVENMVYVMLNPNMKDEVI